MLQLGEDVHVPHDLGEDVPIRQQAPFRHLHIVALELAELAPLLETGHEGEYLEGEAPPPGIRVVQLQQVDRALLSHLLP